MSLLDRTKKVKKLKENNSYLHATIRAKDRSIDEIRKAHAIEIERKNRIIAELEDIKQPATLADMTKIMGFLIDYSHVVARLGAADPVGVRVEIPEIFNKYNINWTPVKPYGF